MSALPMDPNLHGLLVELAERPETVALGARVHRFQDLLRPDTVMVRPMTGMGTIEAKLLEAHREELAHLLLQASQIAVADAVLQRPRGRHGHSEIDASSWSREAQTFVEDPFADAEPVGSLDLLRRAVSREFEGITPLELALASQRLVSRATTRMWVAVHCGLDGDRGRGIQLHHALLEDLTCKLHLSYAWNNIAWLSNELRRFHDALEAGRQSVRTSPEKPHGYYVWFLAALQIGLTREVHRAASGLVEATMDQPTSIPEYVAGLRKQRSRGLWAPTVDAKAAVLEVSASIPAEAEQILEVFN